MQKYLEAQSELGCSPDDGRASIIVLCGADCKHLWVAFLHMVGCWSSGECSVIFSAVVVCYVGFFLY